MGTVIMVAVGGLVMAGCNSSPTLDELAPRFEQDALAVVHYLSDTYAEPAETFEMVADGSEDIDCYGDERQRKFKATFAMRDGDPDDNLDFFTTTIWAAFNASGPRDSDDPDFYTEDSDYYTVSEQGASDDLGTERTFNATNDDKTITFEIRAAGHPGSTVVISGETVCAE